MEEAFRKYLGKGKSAYIDKRRLSPEEALCRIREAGGISVIAHPVQMKLAEAALSKALEHLQAAGLGGIEVYNSCQNRHQAELYKRLAKRFNLLITGGSDFHGANKPDVELGYLGEGVELGREVVEAMKKSLVKRGRNGVG